MFAREFTVKHVAHCNGQLWFADEDSERFHYSDADRHGAMLTGVPIGPDLTEAWEAIRGEVGVTDIFRR